MKLNELIDGLAEFACADDTLTGIRTVLTADDLTGGDKAGFATGVLMGMTYVLAVNNEQGNVSQAGQTLLQLMGEWEAHGIV